MLPSFLSKDTPFRSMIHDPSVDIHALGAYLDGLSPSARREAMAPLRRRDQRELYEKAASAAPLTLEHFVPADVSAMAPVRHNGRNTLPEVALRHRFFAKVFCRPTTDSAELYGYNHAPAGRWIGPGYFVARSTEGEPGQHHRGAVVIDYWRVPRGAVPAAWPRVVPNTRGAQRFVYHATRDYMRRVSRHVSVGAAYKEWGPLDMYFVLCREGD